MSEKDKKEADILAKKLKKIREDLEALEKKVKAFFEKVMKK